MARLHSPETIEKIRLANIGERNPMFHKHFSHSDETREKQRVAALGRKLSIETREKLSSPKPWLVGERNPNFGRIYTEEERQYLREINTGENHPRWLGGISKLPYPFEFTLELKEQIRKRDNYQCQKCGVSQSECIRSLCIHHIDYDKFNLDWLNLISLCNRCNSVVNNNREFWVVVFRTIVYRGYCEDFNN